jgi:hypothetical protein
MGRPLKIQKYSTNSGVGSPGAAVGIDIGFPNFGSLTDPVYNTNPETLSAADYLGVVGGLRTTATSATNPVIKCIVNIANSYTGVDDGVILRQKGSHKFLVATNTAIDPANALTGVSVRIATLGDTNWNAMGAPVGAAVGTIFLVTAAAGAGTTGTCQEVGVCVLDNDATPAAGLMAIGFSVGDSTITYISKLTNKWLLDWTGGNGYTQSDITGDVRYVSNFFTDEGTVIKSGTADTTVIPGQVEKWTS